MNSVDSRPRNVSRRLRVDFLALSVSSAVVDSTDAVSSAVSAAGVAGGSFLTSFWIVTNMLGSSLAAGEALDSLRVLGREVVLPRRPFGRAATPPRLAASSLAAVRRGFLSLFRVAGGGSGPLDAVGEFWEEGAREGARSLIGLISS